jgi:DNA-binding phage protein
MKTVQLPTSDSYHDYLINSLTDIEEATGYLEVALEEAKDEPQLLCQVLKNLIEAQKKQNNLSSSTQTLYHQLENLITQTEGQEISYLLQLIDLLGFEILIKSKKHED